MSHTPYGYRIENGHAVIDEAADAGLETYHGTAKRIMQNQHYLGDDFYPTLIDQETFDAAATEIEKRAGKLGRLNRTRKTPVLAIPTEFIIRQPEKELPTPIERAEYLYSLIGRKVITYATR